MREEARGEDPLFCAKCGAPVPQEEVNDPTPDAIAEQPSALLVLSDEGVGTPSSASD